jgi:hypothetical protein
MLIAASPTLKIKNGLNAEMKVGEVHDIAEPRPVEDIAERTAKYHRQDQLLGALFRARSRLRPIAIAAVKPTSSQHVAGGGQPSEMP